MPQVRCRAKQPLTCEFHRAAREQQAVDSALDILDLTWDLVHDHYRCESRANFNSVAAENRGRQTGTVLRICDLCGKEHPYAPDYVDTAEFWTPKRQYHALRQYVRHLHGLDPRITLPVDFDALVMFDDATAFFTEANMTKKELTAWYVCERKIRHLTEADAEAHLARVNQHDNMGVYHCTLGDHYHVGHTPKGAVSGAPRASTMSRKFNRYHLQGKA